MAGESLFCCVFDLFDLSFWPHITEVSFFLSAPDVKGDGEHLKGIPLPPNPAQVPNPIQLHHAKDQVPAEPVHHRQSESPRNTSKQEEGGKLCYLKRRLWF